MKIYFSRGEALESYYLYVNITVQRKMVYTVLVWVRITFILCPGWRTELSLKDSQGKDELNIVLKCVLFTELVNPAVHWPEACKTKINGSDIFLYRFKIDTNLPCMNRGWGGYPNKMLNKCVVKIVFVTHQNIPKAQLLKLY